LTAGGFSVRSQLLVIILKKRKRANLKSLALFQQY